MDQRVKKKWVKALRSGNYEQGTGYLHLDNKFCCLGVLCDIAVKEGIIPEPELTEDRSAKPFSYSGAISVLPEDVSDWIGLNDSANLNTPVESHYTLWELNDVACYTFEQIAQVIEEQF